jgi:hypothetical protein
VVENSAKHLAIITCAESCASLSEQGGDFMAQCAEFCRKCAESCRKMSHLLPCNLTGISQGGFDNLYYLKYEKGERYVQEI